MEPEITLESHILSLTAAIGTFEDSLDEKGNLQRSYVLGSESIECLRDIKRLLRYDEAKNTKTISNLVGKWEVVQNHLVPIIQYHSENRPIFFAAIELLVPLTWPLRKDQSTPELVHHHRSYKFSIVDSTVINTMFDHLIILLASPKRLLENRDLAMVRLILLFFRNVLAIQDPDSESSNRFCSLHETLVKKLHSIEFLEFCTAAASNINDRSFASINTIFIELFYLLLSPTAPILLYDQNLQQYQFSTFDALVEKESYQTNAPRSKSQRFVANYKYLSEKGMQMNMRSLDFDLDTLNKTKNKPKPTPRKKKVDPLDPSSNIDQSLPKLDPKKCSASHARIIRDTVIRYVQFGFDPLVSSVKRDIDAESSHVRNEDRIQLMFVIKYCLEFRSMNESDVKLPFELFSSVLNVHGLLFLLKNIHTAGDTLNISLLHVSLSCVSIFLQTIKSMLKSDNASHQAVANNMLDHLFCDHDQISMFVHMFRTFKTVPWETLMAMVDTIHHLLSALELWNRMLGRSSIKVRRRKRKTNQVHEDRDHSSSSDSGPEFVDRDVSMNQIEDLFCVDVVVDKYLTALARLDDLTADQVHAVTKMLGRIVMNQNQVAILFKLNYLSVIHKIFHNRTVKRLTDPRRTPSTLPRGCKHAMETVIPKLLAILRLVINRFFVCYEKYPLMIIDVLFPHTRKDLDRLTTGYAADTPTTSSERSSSTVRRAVKAVQKSVDGDGRLDRLVQALEQLANTRMYSIDVDYQDEMLTSIPPGDVESQEMQTLVKTLQMQVLPLTDVSESTAIFGHGLYAICVPGRLDGPVLTRVIDTISQARAQTTTRKRGKGKGTNHEDTTSDMMDEGPKSVPYIYDSDELLKDEEEAFQQREEFCRMYTTEMYHAAVSGDLSVVSSPAAPIMQAGYISSSSS